MRRHGGTGGSHIDGGDAFIEVNRAYPEGWHVTVLHVAAQGNLAVSEVRVDQDDDVFFAASFFESVRGEGVRLDELLGDLPYEEPAEWRAPVVEAARRVRSQAALGAPGGAAELTAFQDVGDRPVKRDSPFSMSLDAGSTWRGCRGVASEPGQTATPSASMRR